VPTPPLNLEILVSRPAGAPVARDYVDGHEGTSAFYQGHFADVESYLAKAREVEERFGRAARERAAAAIRVPREGDPSRVRRFVEEGGCLVTTGQQPGLFGGPLYSLYKAVTAIRLAQALEDRMGKTVLPLFWVASDDHDWAEANHTFVVGVDNELHEVSLPAPDTERHPPLHRVPCGERIEDLRDSFLQVLPNTEFKEEVSALLRAAVTPGATLPGAFAAILEALLGRHGLLFTDAAHPVVKEASLPLLLAELDRAAEMEEVLRGTAERLQAAGYGLQVPLLEGGVNLFLEGAAGRERLYRDGDGFRLRTSGEHVSAAAVAERAGSDPTVLTPNVLLRPVVESIVFPTVAYVAGPGETAYFAQISDYFAAHDVRMPVIHPRLGAFLVESKVRKVLAKFGLEVAQMARPFHELAGDIARDEVPEGVRRAIEGLRASLGKGVGDLQEAVKGVDPTLKGSVQHLRSQAMSALDDLERKVLQAVKRENETALAQLEKAQLHLFPGGIPQERVVNPFYYLARYGGAFLEELVRRFEVNLP
jgi:bacillithiol biosynthesis cysteine-adding enzyme BshC